MCGLLLAETGGRPQHYEKGKTMDVILSDEQTGIILDNLANLRAVVSCTPATGLEDIIRMQKALDSIENIEAQLGMGDLIPEVTE